ncbi:MAG: penicillin acylase family protein, partial [Chloroflexota bacterium]|nr:penicillin acylase family protein [Chloroflexota bacterium]
MTRIPRFTRLPALRRMWVLLVVALVACAGGPSAVAGSTPTAPLPSVPTQSTSYAHATILWDRWGIPHIFAPDDASLFHAFGWAQME